MNLPLICTRELVIFQAAAEQAAATKAAAEKAASEAQAAAASSSKGGLGVVSGSASGGKVLPKEEVDVDAFLKTLKK